MGRRLGAATVDGLLLTTCLLMVISLETGRPCSRAQEELLEIRIAKRRWRSPWKSERCVRC
jgi:hypothetical protein